VYRRDDLIEPDLSAQEQSGSGGGAGAST